jgi:hypothetical protein
MKIYKKVLLILFYLLLAMAIISVVFDFYFLYIIVLIWAFVGFVLETISFLGMLSARRYNTMKIINNVLQILFFVLLIMAIVSVFFEFNCSDKIILIYAFVGFVLATISFLNNVLKK